MCNWPIKALDRSLNCQIYLISNKSLHLQNAHVLSARDMVRERQ